MKKLLLLSITVLLILNSTTRASIESGEKREHTLDKCITVLLKNGFTKDQIVQIFECSPKMSEEASLTPLDIGGIVFVGIATVIILGTVSLLTYSFLNENGCCPSCNSREYENSSEDDNSPPPTVYIRGEYGSMQV
jgi:hypothetical protein